MADERALVDVEIKATATKIEQVESEIANVEKKLETADELDKLYLRKKEELLRKKKEQLREEKLLLMREELLLMRSAAANTTQATGGERVYTVRHVRRSFKATCPSNVKLCVIEDEVEKHWAFFKAARYDLIANGKVMDEVSWAKYLASLQSTAEVVVKVSSKGRSFSQYKQLAALRDLAKDYLGVKYIEDDRPIIDNTAFPQLEVQSEDKIEDCSFEDMLSKLVSTLCGLFMRPEYNIVGKMAWGPVDYVITYRTLGVVVAEAKQDDLKNAWPQIVMQISSTRDVLLRRLVGASDAKKRNHWQAMELSKIPTYAVLCTATTYCLLRYQPAGSNGQQQPGLVTSGGLSLNLGLNASPEETKQSLRSLILALANVFVAQMKAITAAADANPNLNWATDPVSGPDVLAMEEDAVLDHVDEYISDDDEYIFDDDGG